MTMPSSGSSTQKSSTQKSPFSSFIKNIESKNREESHKYASSAHIYSTTLHARAFSNRNTEESLKNKIKSENEYKDSNKTKFDLEIKNAFSVEEDMLLGYMEYFDLFNGKSIVTLKEEKSEPVYIIGNEEYIYIENSKDGLKIDYFKNGEKLKSLKTQKPTGE